MLRLFNKKHATIEGVEKGACSIDATRIRILPWFEINLPEAMPKANAQAVVDYFKALEANQ